MPDTVKDIKPLLNTIIEGIKDLKGENITLVDLNGIENSVCKQFVICNADSNTQVNSIADSIIDKMKSDQSERVWKKEGYENSQWILLDYVDIVVHVFQTEYRDFYKLEQLWADAKVTIVE